MFNCFIAYCRAPTKAHNSLLRDKLNFFLKFCFEPHRYKVTVSMHNLTAKTAYLLSIGNGLVVSWFSFRCESFKFTNGFE